MSQITNYWWVNLKQTFKQEVDGNYLWSPTRKANGSKNHFYENMLLIKPGDIVFSFASRGSLIVVLHTSDWLKR